MRERAEFNKSCNLIGSGSGRNFPIRPALGGRNRHLLKNVSILSGNLLNELCYYVSQNLPVKPLSSTWIISVFHYYLLAIARNCSVCRESCHDYSPKMFGSFARLSLCCRKNKNVIHQTRSVGIGKNCALCLEYRSRPAASGGIQDFGHSFSQYGPPGW